MNDHETADALEANRVDSSMLRQVGPPHRKQRKPEAEAEDRYGFQVTLWTEMIGPACKGEADARIEALNKLLEKYWPPLKAFLFASLHKWRVKYDWIEECLQEFAYRKILLKELITKADRNRGRFRDLLKTALYRFALDKLRREWNSPWREPVV